MIQKRWKNLIVKTNLGNTHTFNLSYSRNISSHNEFLVLTLVQNNKIIESQSVLSADMGVINIDLTQENIEKLISMYPKRLNKLFKKPQKAEKFRQTPSHSFSKIKLPKMDKNFSVVMENASQLQTDRSGFNSYFRDKNRNNK